MKRVLAIWLPNWPVQRLAPNRPDAAAPTIVLHAPGRRGESVAACAPAAWRAGVRRGMPVAEAAALLAAVPGVQWRPADPAADRAALAALAQWCCRFSPQVGLEAGDAPETLLLEVTNLAPLFGGERALVAQAAHALQRRNWQVRLGLADTVGAAWALARYGAQIPGLAAGEPTAPWRMLPPRDRQHARQVDAALAALPLPALRLPAEIEDTLAQLGLACVGDVAALPREQLHARLGPEPLRRLDQLQGAAAEVLDAVDPPDELTVGQTLEFGLADRHALRATMAPLWRRLARLLETRRAGALTVACRLECDDAAPAEFEFGMFRPTACAGHLAEMAELPLERLPLPGPIAAIEIRVVQRAPLVEQQAALFDERPTVRTSRPLALLVDRLAGRLGRDAVLRLRLAGDAQPERAVRPQLWLDRPTGVSRWRRSEPPLAPPGALDRPLSLLARPASLAMTSVVPLGPPIAFRYGGRLHEVARHWGPERIDAGWWRNQRAVRDYYRIETTDGLRAWLFRRRDGRWFLHGLFE